MMTQVEDCIRRWGGILHVVLHEMRLLLQEI